MNSDLQEKVRMDMLPSFLSIEFHVRIFPALIWSRLSQRERAETGFSPTIEIYVALAVCVILVVMGLPKALSHKSVTGWAMVGLGLTGIMALLVNSIFSHRDPPSYDNFLAGVFFFFLSLGMTVGVFNGTLNHSLFVALLSGSGGFIAGYLLGILAGLCFQYLGCFSGILNGLAWLATFGMFIVDLVLLTG